MPKIKTILTQLSRIDAKVMRDVIYTAEKFGSDHSLTLVFLSAGILLQRS